MRFCKFLLVVLLFNGSQAMNLRPLVSALSSVDKKLTEISAIEFIENTSRPNTILSDVKIVFKKKDVDLYYSKINYYMHTNMMTYYADGPIFENVSNAYVAMFLLAGTIVTVFNIEQNFPLIRSAFIALSLALIDGKDSLSSAGIDVKKMEEGIREVETLYPDIYEEPCF
jgi:hypothetical protein